MLLKLHSFICIAIFILLLCNPQRDVFRDTNPRIAVLLDDSESLKRTDFNQARHFAETLVNAKGEFEIRPLSRLTGTSGSPQGNAVRSLTNENSFSAIVLLSDGVTLGGIPLEHAAKNIPIFGVAFGPEQEPSRIRLVHPGVPSVVGVDEPFAISCDVEVYGLENSSEIQIVLESDEKTHENKTVTSGGPVTFSMRLNEPGLHTFRLYADVSKDETIISEDASLEFSIFVRKTPRRILFVDETPRYEYRFLRELFRSRPGWELHTVLLDADPQNVRDDPNAVPSQTLKTISWNEYDLLILGDVGPELFDIDTMLNPETREPACSILCISGPKNKLARWRQTQLRPYFPVDIQTQTADHSEYAETHIRFFPDSMSVFRNFETPELEPMDVRNFYGVKDSVRPGARILAETQAGRPVIALGKYQNRYIYWLGTDATWTWQDPWHHEFWLRTLRLLTENETDLDQVELPQEFFSPELQRLRKDTAALQEAARISGGECFEPDDLNSLLAALPQEKIRKFEKSVPYLPKTLLVGVLIGVLFLSWSHGSRERSAAQ